MKRPGKHTFRVLLFTFLAGAISALYLQGQALTGVVAGRVFDPSGQIVPGVNVTLTDPETGRHRSQESNANGEFLFSQALPGSYSLRAERSGFKAFEQRAVALSASEHLVVNIALELGEVSETVIVLETPTSLGTESADRSGLVDARQLEKISLKGRDYLGTLKLIPGILDTASATREAPGNRALIGLFVNGNRQGTLNMALDGISLLALGGGTGPFLQAAIDAVAQVKVLQTNYQAEYGRSVGGTINTVTKSGTRYVHGGAYYFFRNEALNANDFFANRQGLPRSRYRYNNPGYFVGGPVVIPGTNYNKNHDKLFFFWSHEELFRTVPSSVSFQTFPTALERQGNFSQSLDTNGQLIVVRDPLSNAPFPGNIVPPGRVDPKGQALLNLFPSPNAVDPNRTYNTSFQRGIEQPRRDMILRVDWNISQKTTFYARGIRDYQTTKGDFGFVLASPSWPQLPINYEIPCQGFAGTVIHTFSATKINELTFGVNRGQQNVAPLTPEGLSRNSRADLKLNIPQFYPQSNPFGVIPNATFGGVPNGGQLNIDARFPYFGRNNVWVYMDNYSQVSGAHRMKFGVYVEHSAVNQQNGTAFNGTFAFDRDPLNPLDSGYAFSNALLGSVSSYSEATGHPAGHTRNLRAEWYAQDNWKVTSRFTVDAGLRFYWLRPTYNAMTNAAKFNAASYNRAQQPQLIQPYRDPSTGVRYGRDPVTGQTYPEVKIGSFAPGSGTPNQGMQLFTGGSAIMNTPPIKLAPRLGFAWDVFGNGTTAVRSGFGMYYDRFPDDQVSQLSASPPIVNTPSANYTTISNILSTPLSLSPNSVFGLDGNWKPLSVYNWSLGVQQKLGSALVLDVAYVGNVSRHGMHIRDLNATNYGTNFLASSLDTSVTPARALPVNFLRPYLGYGSIQYMEFASNSNYHSLQTELSKRFSTKLTFSVAYTWSKVLDVADTGTSPVNPVINYNSRNYGPAGFDRRHNFSASWVYLLPKASTKWNTAFSRAALDGWETSGVASFISGGPTTINYALVAAADLTGAAGIGLDSRVDLTCNPNLSHGDKTFARALNPTCVQAPTRAGLGIGNASKYPFTGPGVENFDLSMYKNFRFGKDEARGVQFRVETYNGLNHAQFTALDNTARFDAGGAQVNRAFGQYTAAAPSRRVILALKFYF